MSAPFRWAARIRRAASGEEWREMARAAEDLGYDGIVVPDHIVRDSLTGAQFSPIPALVAAAAATTRLRVGTLVLANDYRDPVLLAKDVATVDVLSGGRFDLGLGAGWSHSDYAALGRALDPPSVRVARLEEALILIRRLFTEDRVDHDGEYYSVRAAALWPRPIQRPHPPFLVGGHGKRLLAVAARHADIVSIGLPAVPSAADIGASALESRVEVVRAVAGSRFEALTLHLQADIRLTANASLAYAETAARIGCPVEDVRASPYFIYGTIDAVAEQIAELRESYRIGYLRVTEDQMASAAALIGRVR